MAATKAQSRATRAGTSGGSARGGTLGSTRRPPDEARQSILAAAERLFYNEGIRAVGVDAVAAAAGVTKRTLYYHFESKEELVAAYLAQRDEATLAALQAAAAQADAPRERILAVFDYVARWAESSAYRGCPFNNAVAEQGNSPKVTGLARRHKETMERWFTAHAAEGGATHPEQLGAQLLVLLDGALNGAAVAGSSAAVVVARGMAGALLDAAGVLPNKAARTKKR